MTFERIRLAALVLLCALLTALTMNRGVYNLLHLLTAGTLGCILLAPKEFCSPRSSSLLLLPAAFFLFVAISPGHLFSDMPLASIMVCAFICGMGICLSDSRVTDSTASTGHMPSTTASVLSLPLLLLPCLCALASLNTALLWAFCAESPQMLWDTRITLLFDHPNALGYATSMVLLGCAVYFRRIPRTWLLPGLVLMGGGLFIVALAGSRGVYVGLAFGALPVLFLLYRRQLLFIVLGGLTIAVLLYVTLPTKHQERLLSALMNPMSDMTILSRLPIWDAAMDGFSRSPTTGNGLRNFEDHHEVYVTANAVRLQQSGTQFETRIANPHNLYVGLLYGYGWAGTALLALVVGVGCATAIRNPGPEAALYLACLLFVLAAGLVDYSLHRKDGILMLFLPMGMLYAKLCIPPAHQAESWESDAA